MMIKRLYSVKIAICLLFVVSGWQATVAFSQNVPFLPYPHQIIEREGFFNMNEFVPVLRPKNASLEEQRAIWMLCEGFENIFGQPLKVTDKAKGRVIVLRNLSSETPPKRQEKMILPVGEEGYQLNITPDKIEIIANSNAGLFYGSQTLLQLFRTSSPAGSINCMTINDMPSSKQRYLCYSWDSVRVPSFNYVKQLIQQAAHFKFNGIAFVNDSLSSPFAVMELFYLRKFAEAYHINIVSDYSECLDNDALFFMDNWYSTFWTAELLWNEPKNNTASLMKQRQTQYEKALDRHFFEVDFSLCEQLLAFNSLKVISLTEVDFWRPVVYDAYSEYMEEIPAHNPANNRFVLTQALALEETLQLLLETAEIRNDAVLYFTLFATQRAGFIALKNLLQESLSQQTTEPETIQETITLLLENIRHLQEVHEILWSIENASHFPPAITQQYEQMILELTKARGE